MTTITARYALNTTPSLRAAVLRTIAAYAVIAAIFLAAVVFLVPAVANAATTPAQHAVTTTVVLVGGATAGTGAVGTLGSID